MDSLMSENSIMALDSTLQYPPSPPASDTTINPQDVTKLEPLDSFDGFEYLSPSASTYGGSPEPSEGTSPPSPASSDPLALPKKKRKSWGQVLPEPTTNLPPRKRAKTDAEKEQRKYERVQRNRQAAHNSRMRKQQEMDNLSKKNKDLESTVSQLQIRILQLERQLKTGESGQLPFSPSDSMSSLWHVPSLYNEATSPSDTTSSLDQAPTPPVIKLEQDSLLDQKQYDDAHSAAMCTLQRTSDLPLDRSLSTS